MRKQPKKNVRGPSKANGSAMRVSCVFAGDAAIAIRAMHRSGMHGPTLPLVVEGLALAEVRRSELAERESEIARALAKEKAKVFELELDLHREKQQRGQLAQLVKAVSDRAERCKPR